MGKMAAGREGHSEYCIAWFEPCIVYGVVGLCTRVWLNIGMVCMEETTSTVYSDAFDAVDVGLSSAIAVVW